MVLELIKRLASQGIGVIVVSHNLTDVFAIADRIAVLYLGKMVAEGPAAEFDSQIVVDMMTTGASSRSPKASGVPGGGG
jgi:ABC-type sugar transport system ATPase subunit